MMAFSSSPVVYPTSSPPPPLRQKRKLFQTFEPADSSIKRSKTVTESSHAADVTRPDSESLGLGDQQIQPSLAHSQGDSTNSPEIVDIDTLVPAQQKSDHQAHPEPTGQQPGPTFSSRLTPKNIEAATSSGQRIRIGKRSKADQLSYEQIVAQRSAFAPGRAKTAYYGVDVHKLIDEAKLQGELDEAAAEFKRQNVPIPTAEEPQLPAANHSSRSTSTQMWTEKYRARKFTELVGDERTHRSVLRWLKGWDQVVFPGSSKQKSKKVYEDQEQQHKKLLLLTGPPGLGKTTLAHVCAKQAGYEVLEINASDDRSRDVVRGRIKDALGTETVRGIKEQGRGRRIGRPACVIVDEVDGVVTGSGGSGGEGGFIKALIDLVQLDQRNSSGTQGSSTKGKKGDKFRLMRPLILICNDVYAPSLRPLRQSSVAEIIHVRKPAIEKVVSRLKTIFDKENIGCDNDAVRRLCESSWGLGTRKQNSSGGRGAGDGDIRGVLVQGEWIAHKLRATQPENLRLTRKWVEDHVSKSTATQDGLGRGGVKEVIERIFIEGAGLPNLPTALSQDDARLVAESKTNPIGVADLRKRAAVTALRSMIDTTGDHDRLMSDCFSTYPTQIFQDDTVLSKPNAGYEWLHFHDMLSSRIYSGQEWELNPYLSTSACGFHDLFATMDKGTRSWNDDKPSTDDTKADIHPFSGTKADFSAYEAEKANRSILTEMQSHFSAPMLRLFSSIDTIATELISNVSRMLAPDVKPIVVGGSGPTGSVVSVRKESEKSCVQRAVRVMHGLSIEFEKVKIETEGFGAHTNGGYALRMEPPIDSLSTYHFSKPTNTTSQPRPTSTAPVRYAIRQVLSQELYKEKMVQANLARQARVTGLPVPSSDHDKENAAPDKPLEPINIIAAMGPAKRDFFGRPITAGGPASGHKRMPSSAKKEVEGGGDGAGGRRTWVSFHEGYSNAVRKYITLKELMDGF